MTPTRLATGFPTLLDRFFDGDVMDWASSNYSSTNTSLPRVNIRENDDEFTIEVAAPGMKKEDFNINLENDQLTVSSEVNETVNENERFLRREYSFQSFQRTFNIAENVINGEKISASYNDGILKISLPKKDEVKPRPPKQIAIK
jgi:HSP20 family protein